jgi:hypothetical protein
MHPSVLRRWKGTVCIVYPFRDHPALLAAFGERWDFHRLDSTAIVYTSNLPKVVAEARVYRNSVFLEYLVYFEGDTVTAAYRIGWN